MPVRLRAGAATDIGPHRSINQDAAFTAPWGVAVADGVGGGPAGDLASAAFIHRLAAGMVGPLDADQLAVRISEANWDLRAHVEHDPSLDGMATTFTGILGSRSGGLLLAHTGDSRAYRLRDGVLTQQTRDDSYVQALVDSGLVAAADAASHPRRNLITASLSGGERDVASIVEHDAVEGDRWLLCSDGLSDYVPDAVIEALLVLHPEADAAARACVDVALDAGTFDNVTAVVCDIHGATPGDAAADAARRPVFHGAAAARFCEDLETA
ncbi:PP2C family protein-serine/threonine phosphatase [Microbacterium pumilum]|uniref:PPM-type phosphatase domain-containing protein n=1 Tax=Microbacterium pumilum TaxID=344165 RepID=A0ABN2SJC1_9MICO